MTINNYLKKERLFLLSSILALFYLVSCQKQPNVTFGSTYVGDNNGANIVVVDTSTINLFTVVVDSTATAGTGFLQVGKLADPYLGTITSRAFLQVAPPSSRSLGIYDTYDSLGLILLFKKSNPFYGDSTQTQTLVVSQVDSLYQLASYQNGFNSQSSLPLAPTALGSTQVIIAPNIPYTSQGSADTVKIKLDDNLGKDLFTKIYNNSDTLNQSAIWLQWFHGLCIAPGPGSHGALYGFQDSATMRIYYHKAGVYSVPAYFDFNITNRSYQFNNITVDRSTSPLQRLIKPIIGLNPQTPPATPSASTVNAAYVQTATGLNVKLTFPYLNDIAKRPDYLSVLRAQLIVRPDLSSFNTTWTLPPGLEIYITDLNNLIGPPLPGSAGVQNGSLVMDFLHPLNMVYTYDVTNFVKAQITNTDPTAKQNGLMLSMPSGSSSFARAVLADATYPVNQRVTLNVYYISLYPHN
ncbi:MAG TPA: DUF4270 family protein [Puia sp.]